MFSTRVAVVPATTWPAGLAVSGIRAMRVATFVMCALLLAVLLPNATVHAATTTTEAVAHGPNATVETAPLKVVIIVGPAGSLTDSDLNDAESLAEEAESYGMDVRRVFYPNATWDNVLANIQGANLVVDMGHGYGWPSPYPYHYENQEDGIGLQNPNKPPSHSTTKYYGGNLIRDNWQLAPDAIVVLNHMCYTAGNGEPGMAIPGWDLAVQRVDNYAAAFLAVGAGAVFAYSGQSFNHGLHQLMTTDDTIADIFTTPGSMENGYLGYVGADAQQFDSVRMPGNTNFLDRDPNRGFIRAVTGNLALTASDWAQGAPTQSGDPPVLSNFAADGGPDVGAAGGSSLPVFTPNGDGNSDVLDMTYTVDREAFVDLTVTNDAGNVVRTISSWSSGGDGSATWDGKNDSGNFVNDGKYTITATPRDRSGNTGDPESLQARVLTAMSAPSASPDFFYPSDGDNLAQTTTFSVTLDQTATFWWKIADADGNVVATHVNGTLTDPGSMTWQWDGRDKNGAYVPDGTYYSVTTAQTDAGTYYNSVPVVVGAFQASSNKTSPFTRGTKAKFFVVAAEPMNGKVKLRLYLPGLTPKTYRMYKKSGYYYVKVTFSAGAGTGQFTVSAFGRDVNGQRQQTDFTYELQ
jgi:flagellar hook assembly protein FlgD